MTLEQMYMVMGQDDGGFVRTVDNSSQAAIVMLGTFNFPAYLSRHPTNFRLTLRENGVDTDLLDDLWESPLEPPWRVQNCEVLSGDLFNAGSSAWRSIGPNCVNLGNSSRIQFNAGVPGTFVGTYKVEFKISSSGSENLCPGTTVVFTKDVSINFTFTG